MSRYDHTVVKHRPDGKRVLKPTIYPRIPIKDSDIFLWWIIAKANGLDEAHIGLEVDKQIRIPTDINPILNRLEDLSY